MSYGYTTPLKMHDAIIAASFESEPPYEFSWAKQGSLNFHGLNWGNADNTLKADIYWGSSIKGWLGTNANIVWEVDTGLTKTINATGTLATPIAGTIAIPQVKGRYMKVVFTLAGTAKTVDVRCWFHGNS